MSPIQLAIIIVSWNVCELLDKCLHSLYNAFHTDSAHTINFSPTVIVADNASSDNSAKIVTSRHPWVKLITFDENRGYVDANNHVISTLLHDHEQQPEIFWLLNPDTVVHKDTIPELVRFIEAQPNTGLVGPKLTNPDGSLQDSAFRFPGLLQPLFDFGMLPERFYYSALNGRYPEKLYNSPQPFKVDHPLGAGMMVRSSVINKVGLLDNRFFMYCEEIDWAWRMKKAGYTNWIVPNAVLTHFGGASTRQIKPLSTAYLWESRVKLYTKHRRKITNQIVATFVRRYFSRQHAETPEWTAAYQRIIQAWQL